MIKLLYKGEIIEKDHSIKKSSSSITLIQTKNHNIIVDTSTKDKKDIIINELRKLKLDVKDIDVVINTHRHRGHIENNEMFKNAEIYASSQESIINYNGCELYSNIDEVEDYTPIEKFQDDEITILKTPGHTYGSISIIYDNYIIAGDTVPLKDTILKDIFPSKIVDYRATKGSLRRIKLLGKHIITGHDGIIYKNEYLNSI
ncbi:MAG: MBL fold metallo-hydrolase [Methanococci archaeon]|nr:MBL fold metallo-hydrolase [Methanococci archaeon]